MVTKSLLGGFPVVAPVSSNFLAVLACRGLLMETYQNGDIGDSGAPWDPLGILSVCQTELGLFCLWHCSQSGFRCSTSTPPLATSASTGSAQSLHAIMAAPCLPAAKLDFPIRATIKRQGVSPFCISRHKCHFALLRCSSYMTPTMVQCKNIDVYDFH